MSMSSTSILLDTNRQITVGNISSTAVASRVVTSTQTLLSPTTTSSQFRSATFMFNTSFSSPTIASTSSFPLAIVLGAVGGFVGSAIIGALLYFLLKTRKSSLDDDREMNIASAQPSSEYTSLRQVFSTHHYEQTLSQHDDNGAHYKPLDTLSIQSQKIDRTGSSNKIHPDTMYEQFIPAPSDDLSYYVGVDQVAQ